MINTDPEVRLHATFATPNPRRGPVALLSESGTIGGALLDRIGEAGLGASSFAAIGNRADVSANDLLQYWADDDRTGLVLLYLESFGNARKFSRIAREMSRTKPIVAVQSGGAARAYPSDGELPPDTLHALLEQTGVIRVDTLSQQLDVARVLACQPLPAGTRVALVGNGGGSLALAADACVDAGLTLAELGEGVRAAVDDAGDGRAARVRASTVDLGFEAVRRRPRPHADRAARTTTGSTACWRCARPRRGSRPPTWSTAIATARAAAPRQDAAGVRVRTAPGHHPRRRGRRGPGVRLPRRRRLRARPRHPLRTVAGGARGRAGRRPTAPIPRPPAAGVLEALAAAGADDGGRRAAHAPDRVAADVLRAGGPAHGGRPRWRPTPTPRRGPRPGSATPWR